MKSVILREVLAEKAKEFISDIRLNILAIWKVKLDYLSFPFSGGCVTFSAVGWVILYRFSISAGL